MQNQSYFHRTYYLSTNNPESRWSCDGYISSINPNAEATSQMQ